MTKIDEQRMIHIAAQMKQVAKKHPWNGEEDGDGIQTLMLCRRIDTETGASLLFTLDYGHHFSGWWKNPDYEKCFHLSIASLSMLLQLHHPNSPALNSMPELTKKVREKWAEAFYQERTRLLWIEPPVSEKGRLVETWHYRLFVGPGNVPLLPRGEVYTKKFTEIGWKSWSEVHQEETTNNEQA